MAAGSFVQVRRLRWLGGAEQVLIRADAILIIEMQHARDASTDQGFTIESRSLVDASGTAQLCPGVIASVDIIQLQACLMQIVGKGGRRCCAAPECVDASLWAETP